MNSRTTVTIAAIIAAASLGLGACSNTSTETGIAPEEGTTAMSEHDHDQHADHSQEHDHGGGHDHKMDGGPAPEGIVEAADPTYPVGTEVILTADHMPGMNGAKATIVGAYKTITYAIDYTPTDGGEPVKNHKWVVQEELEGVGNDKLDDGAEVTVLADHMSGMEGATATIASSTEETVYMVDVDADGMEMKNHKWVVESEIEPAQ